MKRLAAPALKPAVCVPRHHPAFPGVAQLFAPAFRESVGAALSILNAELIPGLQLPATSHADPDGIATDAPFVLEV